jgi:hypothetical protein
MSSPLFFVFPFSEKAVLAESAANAGFDARQLMSDLAEEDYRYTKLSATLERTFLCTYSVTPILMFLVISISIAIIFHLFFHSKFLTDALVGTSDRILHCLLRSLFALSSVE